MAFYEVTYIVRPDATSAQVEQIAKKYADLTNEKGGKVIKTENWGLRTLAYRVHKHRKGFYTMLGMEADGVIVSELERQMRINDDVIRFLTVKVDELTKAPSIQMAAAKRPSSRYHTASASAE